MASTHTNPGPEWDLVPPSRRCDTEGCEDAGIWRLRTPSHTWRFCDVHQAALETKITWVP